MLSTRHLHVGYAARLWLRDEIRIFFWGEKNED